MAGQTIAGVRWQVWAGVVGGVGGLLALTILVMKPKTRPSSATPHVRKVAKVEDRGGDYGAGSTSSGRASRAGKGSPYGRSHHALHAAQANHMDGGRPDGELPEIPPEGAGKKFKKPAWLRGKVLALPKRKPLTNFTVRYALIKRGFWAGRSKSLQAQLQFPKDAVVQQKTFADEKGHFDIHLEAGSYLVQVKAKGYQDGTPAGARAVASGWYRQTFALLAGGRSQIKGKVLGHKAKPLQGVMAIALITGGSRWGWRMLSFGRSAPSSARMAMTNEEGEFVVKDLPEGKYGVLIRAKGFTNWQQRGIELAEGEHKDLGVIQLDGSTGTITGTVYGPDGKGKSGAFVVAMSQGKGGRNTKFMRTDSGGAYTLEDVSAGEVRMFARLGQGMLAARKSHNLTLKAGQTHKHDFHFGQGGMRLYGKVYNPDGTPVANAEVSATSGRGRGFAAQVSSGTATTDAEGNYSISGLQQGLHTISVSINKKPSSGGNFDVQGAENQHDIRLQGGSIKLSFVDQKTQKAPTVPVWAILTWKNVKTHQLMQKADPGQELTFEHLPDQALSLRVFSPGYGAQVRSDLRPGLPNQPSQLKLELTPAGQFTLTLRVPKGTQLTRVATMINIDGKYQWIFTQSTAGGDYELRGLSPGPAQLKIMATGFKPLEVNIDVPTKNTGSATFELTPAPTPQPPTPAPAR